MPRIAAPRLRSPSRSHKQPRSNPCGCMHARANPVWNEENVLKIGRYKINLDDHYNPKGVLLENVFTALLAELERLRHQEGVEIDRDAFKRVSVLAPFYLDVWLGFDGMDAVTRPEDLRAMLERYDQSAVLFDATLDQGMNIRALQLACAEVLVTRAGDIYSESFGSLVYMDALLRAIEWDDEARERMEQVIRELWRGVPFLVADRTGTHCAYSLGAEHMEQKKLTRMMLVDFQSVPRPKARVIEELRADTREYLKRAPDDEEKRTAWRSYEAHQEMALPFLNGFDIKRIRPFI